MHKEGRYNLNALGAVEQHCPLEVPIDCVKILQLKGRLRLLEQPVECAHQQAMLLAVVCHVPGKQLGIHLELADTHARCCHQGLAEAFVAVVGVVRPNEQRVMTVGYITTGTGWEDHAGCKAISAYNLLGLLSLDFEWEEPAAPTVAHRCLLP